ncbi:MAG: hypothetical protein KF819_04235 [Labilithrix sp.]|nr:hypothetical protein [Labilithrix sp.]
MHVAVYGAGALGAVFGVRLAKRAAVTVTFIVRARRVDEAHAVVIERVKKVRDRRESIERPARSAEIPPDADVILLAVGTEDLEAIAPNLSTSRAPIVVLTPMMPRDYARMREAFGDRVLAGMPAVVAYARDDRVVRWWPAPAPTRIDEPRAGSHGEIVRALAARLNEAGLPTRLELGVHEKNPATTVCFIPLGMAVAVAGGLEELARDAELLALALRASREGAAIAERIGRAEPLAALAPLVAQPLAMRAAASAVKRLSPEALFYVDEHFGRKLRVQHRQMAEAMADLARDRGLPHDALEELARRLAEPRNASSEVGAGRA